MLSAAAANSARNEDRGAGSPFNVFKRLELVSALPWLVVGRGDLVSAAMRSLVLDRAGLLMAPGDPRTGAPTLLLSLRAPRSKVVLELLAAAAYVSVSDVRRMHLGAEDWRNMAAVSEELVRRPVWISDELELDFTTILSWCSEHHGGVVVIDGIELSKMPLNELGAGLARVREAGADFIASAAISPADDSRWHAGDVRLLTGWEPVLSHCCAALFLASSKRAASVTMTKPWQGQGRMLLVKFDLRTGRMAPA